MGGTRRLAYGRLANPDQAQEIRAMSAARTAAEHIVRVVQARDAEAYADLFAEEAVSHHPLAAEPLRGRDAIRHSEQEIFDAFGDIRLDVRSLLVDGTRAAIEVTIHARHIGTLDLGDGDVLPPTGRDITCPATWWIDVGEDGRIIESRDYLDVAGFLAQLDAVAA
jgi:steroid delta-isomerase-like uncharacterized protein